MFTVSKQPILANSNQDSKPVWEGDVTLLAKIATKHPNIIKNLSRAAYEALLKPNALPEDVRLDFYEAVIEHGDFQMQEEKGIVSGYTYRANNFATENYFGRLGYRTGIIGKILKNIEDEEQPYTNPSFELRVLKVLATDWNDSEKSYELNGADRIYEKNKTRLLNAVSAIKNGATLSDCANAIKILRAELGLHSKSKGRTPFQLRGTPKKTWSFRDSNAIWSDMQSWLSRAEDLEPSLSSDDQLRSIFEILRDTQDDFRNCGVTEIDELLKKWWEKGHYIQQNKTLVTAFDKAAEGDMQELSQILGVMPPENRHELLIGYADLIERIWDHENSITDEKTPGFSTIPPMDDDWKYLRPYRFIADEIIRLGGKNGFFGCFEVSCFQGASVYGILRKYLDKNHKNAFVVDGNDNIRYQAIQFNTEDWFDLSCGSKEFFSVLELIPEHVANIDGWGEIDVDWLATVVEKIKPGAVSAAFHLRFGTEMFEHNPRLTAREATKGIDEQEAASISEKMKALAMEEWRKGALHPTERNGSNIECASVYAETLLAQGKYEDSERFLGEFEAHFGEIPKNELRYNNVRRTVESWKSIQTKLAKASEEADNYIKAKESEMLERAAMLEKKSEELGQAILRKRVDLEYALNKAAIEELGFDEPKFYEEVKWNVHEYGKNGKTDPETAHFDRSEKKWTNYVWKPLLRWFGVNKKSKLSFVLPTLRASYLGEWKEFLMDAGRKYLRADTAEQKPDIENIRTIDERMSRMIREFDEILSKDQDRNLKSRIFGYLILFFIFETVALLLGVWYVFEKIGADAIKLESLLSIVIGATITQITAMIFFIVRGLYGKEQNKNKSAPDSST